MTTPASPLLQSACYWCFNTFTLPQFAALCAEIGLLGIDLVGPEHFPTLRQFNLVPTMLPSHSIAVGLNRTENHADCLAKIAAALHAAAEAHAPNVVCFSGNRAGLDDATGLQNCLTALRQITPLAESLNVTLCMELLNSKLNHHDYMCDSTAWGAKLVRTVASPRFKLLYDIYHMQVQEGDIIATIRQYADCIGHYHTGGVPGRHEINSTQELNYPAIVHAIRGTGFTGWLAHEFLPTADPRASLLQAIKTCTFS